MKKCKQCGVFKKQDDFEPTISGRRRSCRECRRKYFTDKYRNSPERRKSVVAWRIQRTRENMKKCWDYLLIHPCVDCDEIDPVVLEFDHVKGTKKASVSFMISHGFKWEDIELEIAKCQIRCANCHRRKTAKSLGWYKYLGA